MSRAIPDRWLNYKAVGNPIEGTRFVAFKVPLRPNVNKSVKDVENRLDDIILLEKLPNLGFIIDLTNTKRYYDPERFQNRGVQHLKILVPGRVVPPEQLVKRFNDAVSKFLHDNNDNDKLIGVHCTHGVNRSGFFICNYMISQLKINPIDAIKRFSDARGHPIERENYLNALNCGNAQSEHPTRIDSSSTPMESGSLNSNWQESAKNDVNSRSYNAQPRNDNKTNWRERGGAEPIRRGNGNVTRQINTGTRNIEHQQYDDRGSRRNSQNEQRGFRRSDNERSKARSDAGSDKGYEPNRRDERRYNSNRHNAGARSDNRHYDSGAVIRRDDRRFNSDRCDADARSDDIRYDSGVANRRDERGYNTDCYSANARSDDIRYDSGAVNRIDDRGYNSDRYNGNARSDDIRYDSGAFNRIDDGGYNSDRYNANARSDDIRYDSGAFNRIDDGGYNSDRYNSNARPDDIRYDSGAFNRRDDRGYNSDRYNANARSDDIRYDSGAVNRIDDRGYNSDRYNAGAVNRRDDDSRYASNGRDDLRFYSSDYGQFNSHETQKLPMFAPRPVPLPLPLPLPMPLPLPLPPPMPLPTQANGHSEFTGSRFARSQNFLLEQRNSMPTHNYNQNKSWNKDNNRNVRTEPTAFYSRKPAASRIGSNASSSLFGRSSNNHFVNS